MIYAIAGYGTGNLGDDAIFQGLLKEHPKAVQIYVNLPSHKNNIWYGDIQKNGFPEEATNGELIIGGGGIFHSRQAIVDFLSVVEKAKLRGMKVSIRKVGAEYLSYDYAEEAIDLCRCAHFVSVRSKRSKEILDAIGACNVKEDKDYAYNLVNDVEIESIKFPSFPTNRPTIGLVTAGNRDDLDKIAKIIKFLTTDFGFGDIMCNVVHIPHCRHYVSASTNDVVTGEMLWSMVDIYHAKRYDKFKLMQFPDSCLKLLNAYTKVDAIIGLRYHSFIFSELVKKPLLGLTAGAKAETYFNENKRKNSASIDIGRPLEDLLEAVFQFCARLKKLSNENFYKFTTKGGSNRVEYLLKELGE